MQMDDKRKLIQIAFIVVVLISLGFLLYICILPFFHTEIDPISFSIYIRSNDDFDQYNFPGSGTEEDPYIIENYTYSENKLTRISISSVSKNFIIRNNIIYASSSISAVSLSSISSLNNKVINNTVYSSTYNRAYDPGISIYNLHNISILNNYIYNRDTGIEISSSTDSIIANNYVIGSGRNIEVRDCIKILIMKNILMVDIDRSRYILPDSINIEDSLNISIYSNECENSGIWFSFSSSSTIDLQNNTLQGLKIGFFKNQENLVLNESHIYGQLIYVNCSYCDILNLNLSKSVNGISFYDCSFINCTNCGLYENLYSGIYITNSNNLTIFNSEFQYCHHGIRIRDSYAIELLNNNFQNNYYGIYATDSTIINTNNTFSDNTHDIN